MVSQEDSYVFVGIDKPNERGSPANRRGNVEKGEYCYLEDDEPEKYDINELDHFLDLLIYKHFYSVY